MKPAHFRLSKSFLNSSSFASMLFPVYSSPRTITFSLGLAGLSFPQTTSTRFSATAFSSLPPFFLIFSDSFRASAVKGQQKHSRGCSGPQPYKQ